MKTTTMFRESTQFLRRAIGQGIIDPHLQAIQKKSLGKINLFQPLMRQLHDQAVEFRADTRWLGKQNTWVMPATRRYQNSIEPEGAPLVVSVASNWLVELARWAVSDQDFGIVKSFEQYLSFPTVQGPRDVYTKSANWGDPYAFPATAGHVQWYFRLSPVSTVQTNAWINVTGPSAIADNIPGEPYTDLPKTADLWYPASSSSGANIHLPVPGGFVLRVFLLAPAMSAGGLSAACKLSGTTQTAIAQSAQEVAQISW